MESANSHQVSEDEQAQRQVSITFRSPFIKERLNQPFNMKSLAKFITDISQYRQEIIANCPKSRPDEIDKRIAQVIQQEYKQFSSYFEEAAAKVTMELLEEIQGKVDKILEQYQSHKNKDQTAKELQNYQSNSNPSSESQIINKFSAYFNKNKDKQQQSQETKSLSQQSADKFTKLYLQAMKQHKDLKKCFYFTYLEGLETQIELTFKVAYQKLQFDENTMGVAKGNPKVEQEYQMIKNELQPCIQQVLYLISNRKLFEGLALLGDSQTRDIMIKSLIYSLFPMKQSKFSLFSQDLNQFISLYFGDCNQNIVEEQLQKFMSLMSSMQLSSLKAIHDQKALIQNPLDQQQLNYNLIMIYLVIMKIVVFRDYQTVIQRNYNEPHHREIMYAFLKSVFKNKTKAILTMSVLEQEVAVFQCEIKGTQLNPMSIVLEHELTINDYLKNSCSNPENPIQAKTLEFIAKADLPKAKLEVVAKPEKIVHKHIIIAISGFLSENSNQGEDWSILKKYCEDYGYPLLCVRWEAQSVNELAKIGYEGLKSVNINFSGLTTKGLSSLLTTQNLKSVASAANKLKGDTVSLFKKARENARMTGKLLGHLLALGTLFDSYSFSLIGFSLGSQVIKSCVNTIYKLNPNYSPLHNVYFLGGATYIRPQKLLLQKKIFSIVVSGKIKNVFTENDTTLHGFQQIFDQTSLGRSLQYKDDFDNLGYSQVKEIIALEQAFILMNYDISSFCNGHLNYRKCLDRILDFIDFEF